jgi:hypothetical protein
LIEPVWFSGYLLHFYESSTWIDNDDDDDDDDDNVNTLA